MKKQLLMIGIVTLLVYVELSGCVTNTDKEKFIGSWTTYQDSFFVFNKNDTFKYYSTFDGSREEGNWNINENAKTITLRATIGSGISWDHFNYRIIENNTGYMISLQGINNGNNQSGDWFTLYSYNNPQS